MSKTDSYQTLKLKVAMSKTDSYQTLKLKLAMSKSDIYQTLKLKVKLKTRDKGFISNKNRKKTVYQKEDSQTILLNYFCNTTTKS